MNLETEAFAERFTKFGIDIVRFVKKHRAVIGLPEIESQLIRSATSIGANYLEAQRTRTKREFTSSLQIALREAEETRYWLRVNFGISGQSERLDALVSESTEIIAILTAACRTAKRRNLGTR